MSIRLLASLFLAALLCGCTTRSEQPDSPAASTNRSQFVFGPQYVYMPEGYFVLVRKGESVGAFKLLSVQQREDGTGSSRYESYRFKKGETGIGLARAGTSEERTGEITIKQVRGLHPFTWQPGKNELRVGSWSFGCLTPSLVNMSARFAEDDEGFEFAPTRARDISEVRVSDAGLRWYRYSKEGRTAVEINQLPVQ